MQEPVCATCRDPPSAHGHAQIRVSVARNPGQALQPSRLWRGGLNDVNVLSKPHRLIAETGWRDSGLTWLEVDTQGSPSHAGVVVGCVCIRPASLEDPRPPSEWLRSCNPTEWAWIGPRRSSQGPRSRGNSFSRLPFSSTPQYTVPYVCTSTPLAIFLHIHSLVHPPVASASVTSKKAIYEFGETITSSVTATTKMNP